MLRTNFEDVYSLIVEWVKDTSDQAKLDKMLLSKSTAYSEWDKFVRWVLHDSNADRLFTISNKQIEAAIESFRKQALRKQKQKMKLSSYDSMEIYDEDTSELELQ